jgi:tRNA U34 5-carboxymethylaminomethyl modifying GTPase MnmE/TrmE
MESSSIDGVSTEIRTEDIQKIILELHWVTKPVRPFGIFSSLFLQFCMGVKLGL